MHVAPRGERCGAGKVSGAASPMPFGTSNAACSSKACLGLYGNDVSLCHYVHLQRCTFIFPTRLPVGSQASSYHLIPMMIRTHAMLVSQYSPAVCQNPSEAPRLSQISRWESQIHAEMAPPTASRTMWRRC